MSAADRRRMRLGFAVLFALVFLRVCRYGLSYLPMLDDYIQYYNYANLYPDRAELLRLMGAFSARPLAGVLDIVFWSRFWDHLIAAVALLSALYAAAGMLFFSVWRRRLGATWLFPVLFALFPWGLEGTYWLSASTRIVPGMFFTALALWCFDRWCEQGGKGALVGYFLAQLLSFGFYEQTLLLSCACLVLGFALWAGKALRRALAAAWTFVCGGAYLLVTTLAPAGNLYGARTALLLP